MNIKEDLKKKIDALSEKMDEQLNKGNFHDYSKLADTYLRLVREYESIDKPNKYGYAYLTNPTTYFTTNAVSTNAVVTNPLEYSKIHCNTSEVPNK
ncbi:hypothetical protein [Brevibacillus sp. NRS-1366]|uniref:hypothetical protein n=1 Tax=Brevibacillus sp. NRS-1366 TaxID=3233899 RepID=UPI003D1E494C